MNKRIISVVMLLLLVMPLAACSPGQEPIPDRITHPEGRVVSVDPKAVEGRIKELENDSLVLLVENVKWNFSLTEQVQKDIETLNEKGVTIRKGSFVLAYYDEENGERQITRIEKLRAN